MLAELNFEMCNIGGESGPTLFMSRYFKSYEWKAKKNKTAAQILIVEAQRWIFAVNICARAARA